ncbi:hypothetical protein [Gelidibacter sp. F63206]|uniref:hypothetical protein n=1 Tax=Gelidibacter sp. F63206 TaxID=2926425 RepID=UPI001FF38C9E|nr:hypothetical protein [Gelidibacter sp. F63206]MCK0115304.1 hypothetical protein [Gelidibacter sp. F63206]
MKRLILIIVLIPFFAFNIQNNPEDFVGKRVGSDNNDVGAVIFEKDGYAAFEIGGQIMGGKEFVINGKRGQMTYSINKETRPIQIDFILTKLESGEQKTLLAIAEFIEEDVINFALSFEDIRPSSFDEKSVILTRVKP